MQLLRSADVTTKVQKQLDNVRRRLEQFRVAVDNRNVLELPMGTYCTTPFPCPHIARCREEAPSRPLFELPELTRPQEVELHKEGIEQLTELDAQRPGLTFRQRRTLASVQGNERIVEPFVANELRQCKKPLHFVAMAAMTEPLPRFERQHPWQLTPYGWSAYTMHEDGRIEKRAFVHADRSDPRSDFVRTLADHLECGGTVMCWDDEVLQELHGLLDSMPENKAAVRSLMGKPHLDMMQLLEAGVFDPELRSYVDLREVVRVLCGDESGDGLEMLDVHACTAALQKALTPRIRSATKEKIAADITEALTWQAEHMLQLFQRYAEVESAPTPKPSRPSGGKRSAKPLPKLPDAPE
jgi:hypothetical protein